jgi:hypothetical protein
MKVARGFAAKHRASGQHEGTAEVTVLKSSHQGQAQMIDFNVYIGFSILMSVPFPFHVE